MDVEKTIEVMLEREARVDARLDEITELVRQNSVQIHENSAQINKRRLTAVATLDRFIDSLSKRGSNGRPR